MAGKAAASKVSFTLEPIGDTVKLTFIHDQVPSQEMADGFGKAWIPILSSLKSYLETGKPLQFA